MNGESRIRRVPWLLAAVLLLVAVVLTQEPGLWGPPQSAQALENPIEARNQMISELEKINQKLDQLINLMQSGKVKVVVSNAEELKAEAAPAARGPAEKPDAAQPNVVILRDGGR